MHQGLPELLAPAGSIDALLAAVAGGADAVYCGVGAFNARAAAADISWDIFGPACTLAHAHGVRVYVTLNVYLREGELADAIGCAKRAAALGADAFIVADAGLASALADAIPGVELHLSTQAGVGGPAGVRFARRKLGIERLCCARELSLAELADLVSAAEEPLSSYTADATQPDSIAPIGIEAFCHGAICICYSGACTASAHRRGRSANRGDCTQQCRLPYTLVDECGQDCGHVLGDRLLCPSDYLSIRHIPELVRSGVSALKIEGRMKKPDYVYNVVRVYRAVLDAVVAGVELQPTDLDQAQAALGRSFNRGFTDAYLMGRSDASLMSFERAINQGVYVGELIESRHEEVLIRFDIPVSKGDTLEIRSTPGPDAPADVPKRWPMVPCPCDVAAGEQVALRCKRRVEVGSPVHLTASAQVRSEASLAVARLRSELDEIAQTYSSHSVSALAQSEALLDGSVGALPHAAGLSITVAVATPEAAGHMLADPRVDRVAVPAWCISQHETTWSELLPQVTVMLDEALRAADEPRADALIASAGRVMCRTYGALELLGAHKKPFEVATPLSITHAQSIEVMKKLGASCVWLPDELSCIEVQHTLAHIPQGIDCGLLVYGVPQLMICEHCVLTAEGLCSGRCTSCVRRTQQRFLMEAQGDRLPVRVDVQGRTRLFDAQLLDRIGDLAELVTAGLSNALIDATLLTHEEIDEVLARVAQYAVCTDA